MRRPVARPFPSESAAARVNGPSLGVTDKRHPEVLARARVLVRALIAGDRSEVRPSGPVSLDDETVALASTEGVTPWLGAAVAQGRIAVPSRHREQLVWEHQMCLAANVVRARTGAQFAERCREAGIAAAWLKGMAMVQGILPPGERSMIDVDVLVPASRWGQACQLASRVIGDEVVVAGRPYTAAHDYVRAFTSSAGVTLEVHRYVCESSLFGIDHEGPDGLFARARPGQGGISVLDEGDLFLTFAAHAAKHTFELPLRSFLDGIVLLRRGRLNMATLQARARGWRMETALQLWLRALAVLAPGAFEAPNLPGASPLAGLVWSRTREASAWQRFLRLGWIVDGPGDWVRHVASRVLLRARDAVSPT